MLDIQSCVVSEGFDPQNGRAVNPHNLLRINIGTMRDLEIGAQGNTVKQASSKMWHDGVLEVVGYTKMSMKEIELERMMLLAQQQKIGLITGADVEEDDSF